MRLDSSVVTAGSIALFVGGVASLAGMRCYVGHETQNAYAENQERVDAFQRERASRAEAELARKLDLVRNGTREEIIATFDEGQPTSPMQFRLLCTREIDCYLACNENPECDAALEQIDMERARQVAEAVQNQAQIDGERDEQLRTSLEVISSGEPWWIDAHFRYGDVRSFCEKEDDCVKACVDSEPCMEFAKENDWKFMQDAWRETNTRSAPRDPVDKECVCDEPRADNPEDYINECLRVASSVRWVGPKTPPWEAETEALSHYEKLLPGDPIELSVRYMGFLEAEYPSNE